MRRSTQAMALLVATTTLAASGCSGDGNQTARSAQPGADAGAQAEMGRASGTAPEASAARVALPGLFSIMIGLDSDMARISRGLWLENLDTIAAGADAVANHPRVPPEEFQRIQGVLGEEMSRFGGMDMRVHDLAVRLAEEARREDFEAVLSTDAELRRACVSCHSTFRERLREEIR